MQKSSLYEAIVGSEQIALPYVHPQEQEQACIRLEPTELSLSPAARAVYRPKSKTKKKKNHSVTK